MPVAVYSCGTKVAQSLLSCSSGHQRLSLYRETIGQDQSDSRSAAVCWLLIGAHQKHNVDARAISKGAIRADFRMLQWRSVAPAKYSDNSVWHTVWHSVGRACARHRRVPGRRAAEFLSAKFGQRAL